MTNVIRRGGLQIQLSHMSSYHSQLKLLSWYWKGPYLVPSWYLFNPVVVSGLNSIVPVTLISSLDGHWDPETFILQAQFEFCVLDPDSLSHSSLLNLIGHSRLCHAILWELPVVSLHQIGSLPCRKAADPISNLKSSSFRSVMKTIPVHPNIFLMYERDHL